MSVEKNRGFPKKILCILDGENMYRRNDNEQVQKNFENFQGPMGLPWGSQGPHLLQPLVYTDVYFIENVGIYEKINFY